MTRKNRFNVRNFKKSPDAQAENDTKAVVDIGSNSFKLRVARRQKNGLRILLDITDMVRLGRGLRNGYLEEETIIRGVRVLRRLVRLATDMGARPRLVGTMALRTAKNASEFVDRVRKQTGLTIEILSGEEEARLAWRGATFGMSAEAGEKVVFDTGGGSTEFVFGSGTKIVRTVSVAVGAVRLTEKFFGSDPVAPEAVSVAEDYVREMFRAANLVPDGESLHPAVIGLGGGVVAMASVKLGATPFNPVKVAGLPLTRSDIDAQVKLYASLSLAERTKIPGMPARRADLILASACIVRCAMEMLGVETFQTSIDGLRHGLIVEMLNLA
jgi:exopolyphosphatase/guanosine-5'-triphosphate,3'-diphosphate pyrophosphatase